MVDITLYEKKNAILRLLLFPFHRWPHLLTYWCFGVITTAIDVTIFTSLVEFVGVYYIIANCISVSIGICISFLLNSKYNFKVTDDKTRRFTIFFLVGLTGIFLSNVILYCVTEILVFFYLIGKVVSLVSVSLCKFTFNKFVTFKTK